MGKHEPFGYWCFLMAIINPVIELIKAVTAPINAIIDCKKLHLLPDGDFIIPCETFCVNIFSVVNNTFSSQYSTIIRYTKIPIILTV